MEFTQEYLRENKIAIRCRSKDESIFVVKLFKGYNNYDAINCCFTVDCAGEFSFHQESICKAYEETIIPVSEVIKLWEESQKPKGKIIGYKAPFDMFLRGGVGQIAKGDLYIKPHDFLNCYTAEKNQPSDLFKLPSEIVETWEAVYEEPEKELTREEITKRWVEENKVKVGDKIRVDSHLEMICEVYEIYKEQIGVMIWLEDSYLKGHYPIERLQKVTPRLVPYTYEDRGMFRGKWIVVNDTLEALIITITKDKIAVQCYGFLGYFTYEEALEKCKYTDGIPFGKEVYE